MFRIRFLRCPLNCCESTSKRFYPSCIDLCHSQFERVLRQLVAHKSRLYHRRVLSIAAYWKAILPMVMAQNRQEVHPQKIFDEL